MDMLGSREPPTSGPDFGGLPARKRRRPALSCVPCRRRKVKCDRQDPCGPCSRVGNPNACHYYSSHPPATTSSRRPPESTSDAHPVNGFSVANVSLSPAVQPQYPALEPSLHNAFVGSTGDSGYSHMTGSTGLLSSQGNSSQPSSLGQTLQDLQDRLRRTEQLLAKTNQPSSQSEQMAALKQSVQTLSAQMQSLEQRVDSRARSTNVPSATVQDSGLSVPTAAPRLRANPAKTKFWGPSHYLNSFEQNFQLFTHLKSKAKNNGYNDHDAAEVMGLVEQCRTLRRRIKSQRRVQITELFPDIASTIPSRNICDELVDHYLRTFELIYRVLHIPSFRKQYKQYWEHPQDAPLSFVMKLVLILAIGSVFEPTGDHASYIRNAAPRWIYAAQWWLTGPSEKSAYNLEGLQVYCLLLLARQALSIGSSGSIWTLSGSLLRVAYVLGLHRDPKHFPDLSVINAELRRRLWATVLELILQTAMDASMPVMLSLNDTDCDAPSNVNDADFDENTRVAPVALSETVCTQTSIQILLRRSLRLRLEVMQFLNNFGENLSYEKALRLSSELKSVCHANSIFLQQHLNTSNDGTPGPTVFHKKLLDMIFWQPILLLHRPFMMRARSDPQFHFSRKAGLESAMVLLSHLGNLDVSGRMDEFDRLTLTGMGTFKAAISLNAIIMASLEIITQLDEEISLRVTGSTTSVMSNMGRLSRSLLIQTLQHMREQLLHLVAQGDSSLKRFIFLSTALGQIQAMEAGEPTEPAVCEAMKQSLQSCHSLLSKHVETLPSVPPDPARPDLLDGILSTTDGDMPSINAFDSMMPELNLSLDPSWLLSVWDNDTGGL